MAAKGGAPERSGRALALLHAKHVQGHSVLHLRHLCVPGRCELDHQVILHESGQLCRLLQLASF